MPTAWIIRIAIWALVAVRPSYRLLLVFAGILAGVAYSAAVFSGDWARITLGLAMSEAILLGVGVPIVAVRKWLKARHAADPPPV